MTETPVDALRRRARTGLLESAARAPARAHFRAMGIDPARLGGPIIGVASTWTGTMPCNLNQRELADRVSEGVSAAGGLALGFNTIAVSDNQSQGTPGMRASLISREVIADSIELTVHAHDFDGLVCVVGCDKTVPAALMALLVGWQPPPPRYDVGVFARYRALVSSASDGAVLVPPA